MMAKSRVAPAKQVTLPRLELLAPFITANLINYVMEALQIMTDAVYGWSDSQIALAWIKGPSSRWKVFVANRVQDIQQRVAPSQWRFCPGNQNPADFLTRGISASQLKENELWWNGPQWLKQSCRHSPVCETLEREDPECLVEARKETQEVPHASCFVCLPPVDESTALATRYETWQRLIRITVHLHVHLKASHAGPETTLAVLRQRFWLTQGRLEVKRVLRKCLTCKHWRTQPVQQKMAPLPAERVQIAPPFTNIGLDFTGPLYLKVKEGSKTSTSKAYVSIFICEDSRAVHLELLNSMTTEDFLQAFRCMANRRGMVEVIHSDNQTTFHKATKVFKASTQRMKLAKIDPSVVEDKLADQGLKRKFITERASHRGGQWERVCRQLKEPLRKVLGRAFLTYTEMMTVLTDIDAMINSRPLTYIGDDIRDGRIITPALLAIGRDLEHLLDNPPKKADVSLSERYRYQQRLQNHFWSRWLREYLPRLTVRQKWTRGEIPLKENDVVLISEDNLPRGKWRIGKVIQTYPRKDDRVRTVKLQTKKGIINRPVEKLHLLEEHKHRVTSENRHEDQADNEFPEVRRVGNDCSSFVGEDVQARVQLTYPYKSRFGRVIRPPKRL